MENLKEILLELGYTNITDNGKEVRTRPVYRESGNNTSLRIVKSTGRFVDFGANISGPFEDLVKLTLNLKSISEARQWLSDKLPTNGGSDPTINKPTLKQPRVFSKASLNGLGEDHSYWMSRGISLDTITTFGGGIEKSGAMRDRYVFPIYSENKDLIGLSGRDTINSRYRPKWKHMGNKTKWRYPLQVNSNILRSSRKVIIVESIGDMLSLWDVGIKNIIVSFGVSISSSLSSLFLMYNMNEIVISLNNDFDNNNIGNIAANKCKSKLLNHFDEHQVKICLPPKNDFGEMTKAEILSWRKTI